MKKRLLICLTFFALMLNAKLSWAVNTYTWKGTTSTAWNVSTNWSGGPANTYPGQSAGDIVQIGFTGSTTITNWPVLSSTLANSIASITIGVTGGTSPSLTVTGVTLTVTGDITYTTGSTFNATLAGSGTINAANLNVTSTSTGNGSDISTLTSSINTLTLSGNLIITTDVRSSGTKTHDITFNSTTATLSLAGITTNNPNAQNTSTITIGTNTTLNFSGGTAAELTTLDNVGTNDITFGPGLNIGYTGNTAQTVYTSTGIANSTLTSGISYANLTFSGSGTKTASSGNLNISGNFTNSTGSLQSIAASTVFNGSGAQAISLGSGVTFSNVTFSGTGITTVSSGTMNVTGNFTNSLANDAGDYVDFTTNSTALNFTGTTQALAGGSGNGTDFKNVSFSGGGTKTMSGLFNVISTGTLTMGSGSTTLAAGSGILTLKSDANGAAYVAAIPSGSSITGNGVNVQRYLTGGSSASRGWRLLSSPVAAASGANGIMPNLTYVAASVYTTGSNGTGGGFDATGNPSFYFYRENMAPNTSSFISGNFRGVNKINNSPASTFSFDGGDGNASLPAGNGFLFFDRGDKATTTNPTTTTSIAQPTTLTASGYLNQGPITVKPWFTGALTLSYTAATPTSVRGFNLVGNPYASSINWDGMTKTNITSTIWVYNPILKVYATYVAGTSGVGTNFNGASGSANIIPSGQGFFVKATSTAAALTFNETDKVSNQVSSSNLLLAAAPVTAAPIEYFRIQIFQDPLDKEDALVFFNKNASANFVPDEDGEYYKGESKVNISTQSADNVTLAINQLPHTATRQTIPLNVNISADGTYQLNLTEIKNVPQLYDIYLIDAYKKDSVDIKNNPSYSFTATVANANTYGSGRFSLVIKINPNYKYQLVDFSALKVLNTVQLSWKTQNEFNGTIFTVERSTDGGLTYAAIDTTTSTGAGLYSYTDQSPNLNGQNFYRLKQQDITGAISYSIIVSANFLSSSAADSKLVKVYPNPSSSVINLTITSNNPSPVFNITITNLSGNRVKTVSTSQTNWQGNVSTLSPGTYFIQVIDDSNKKLVGRSSFVKL